MPGVMARSPTHEPIMMMRPPLFICFSAACVATKVPRTLMSIRRSSSPSVVSELEGAIDVQKDPPETARIFGIISCMGSILAKTNWVRDLVGPLTNFHFYPEVSQSCHHGHIKIVTDCAAKRSPANATPHQRMATMLEVRIW